MSAEQLRAVMSALYLRGGPGGGSGSSSPVPAARAASILHHLRAADLPSDLSAADCLEGVYCWEEASVLRYVGRLEWARSRVAAGEALSLACPGYPAGWRGRLGASAPPALHLSGELPRSSVGSVAVVGCREIVGVESRFAVEFGAAVVRAGFSVVSGGARGADEAALSGAVSGFASAGPAAIQILPCGLASPDASGFFAMPPGRGATLAVAAPQARLRSALAMERNVLVYSFGVGTVVVAARYGEGGTWHGAREALRRRLGPVAVWLPSRAKQPEEHRRGARALVALGARPVASVADALHWLQLLSNSLASAPPGLGAGLSGGRVAEPSLWDAYDFVA